jgi:hypothetical protein
VPSRQKPKVKDHRGTRASAVIDTAANSVKAESDDDEETEGVEAIAGAEGEEEHNEGSGKVKELEETSEVEESDESEDEGDDTDYENSSKNRSGDGKEQSPHIVTGQSDGMDISAIANPFLGSIRLIVTQIRHPVHKQPLKLLTIIKKVLLLMNLVE